MTVGHQHLLHQMGNKSLYVIYINSYNVVLKCLIDKSFNKENSPPFESINTLQNESFICTMFHSFIFVLLIFFFSSKHDFLEQTQQLGLQKTAPV